MGYVPWMSQRPGGVKRGRAAGPLLSRRQAAKASALYYNAQLAHAQNAKFPISLTHLCASSDLKH